MPVITLSHKPKHKANSIRLWYIRRSGLCVTPYSYAMESPNKWSGKACPGGHLVLGVIVCTIPASVPSKQTLTVSKCNICMHSKSVVSHVLRPIQRLPLGQRQFDNMDCVRAEYRHRCGVNTNPPSALPCNIRRLLLYRRLFQKQRKQVEQ